MAVKILIVDNDEMMRIFLRDVFWIHGDPKEYEVEAVKNADEANDYLQHNAKSCPDVIFVDLVDANASGHQKTAQLKKSLDFIRAVKENGPCKDKGTSIIIFSAYDDPALREKAKEAGAEHFLVKGEQMPKEIIGFVKEHYAKSA